jgi:hypothetical protein
MKFSEQQAQKMKAFGSTFILNNGMSKRKKYQE